MNPPENSTNYILRLLRPMAPGREAAPGWIFDSAERRGVVVEADFRGPEGGRLKIRIAPLSSGSPSAVRTKNLAVSWAEDAPPSEALAELQFLIEFQLKKNDDMDADAFILMWNAESSSESKRDELAARIAALEEIAPPRDAVFHLIVGSKCDNRCVFCEQTINPTRAATREFTLDEYVRMIRLNERFRLSRLRLSGGEVLAFDGIFALAAEAGRAGFVEIEVHTSGRGLEIRETAERAAAAGINIFSIPIYSREPETHDEIVGRAGAWDELERALTNLASLDGVGVNLYTLILKRNYKDLDALAAAVREKYPRFGRFFNTVRPVTGNIEDYRRVVPRYTDVAASVNTPEVLSALPFCVRKKRTPDFDADTAAREKQQNRIEEIRIIDLLEGKTVEEKESRIPPRKCAACRLAGECNHPFQQYIDLFGDDEFKSF